MRDLEHVETLWVEHRAQQFRQEHMLDRWRSLAVIAVVFAVCGWGALLTLIFAL